MPSGELTVEAPPAVPRTEGIGPTLLMSLLPVLAGLGSVVVVVTTGRGSSTAYLGAGLVLVASLGFAGATVWRSRTGRASSTRTARRDYLDHLDEVRREIRGSARQQRAHLHWSHPDPRALVAIAEEGSRVWERSPGDGDFLAVRFATGPHPLALRVVSATTPRSGHRDPVADTAARRLLAAQLTLAALPTWVRLDDVTRVQITGAPTHTRALARAVVAQAVTFHSPDDLVVAVLTSAVATPYWEWVKWVPHSRIGDKTDPFSARSIVSDNLDDLVRQLPGDLTERFVVDAAAESNGSRVPTDHPHRPHVLVIVDGVRPPPDHPLLARAGRSGFTLLDLATPAADLTERPRDRWVRWHLETDSPGSTPRISVTDPGGAPACGVADQLAPASAEATARRLTPRYAGRPARRAGAFLEGAELTDLLGIEAHHLHLTPAWAPRSPRERLRVPIGTDDEGVPVSLDLKESAHHGMGPHGLVIGATGSGKSELLRTLVLGLALTHSPEELNLVLVDFKGGATFAGMSRLPHVSAVITNLADELTLVDRMQDALSGEITRRQELLRASGNHGSRHDYELARTSGAAPHLVPLTSLLVVCDEFSELLSAKPELIDLFVAIGRLGRSLGIHLLLASQRLEEGRLRGLESHLSYRIGLRTFSSAESRSVIGVGDAYELPPVPGLGFLRPDPSSLVRFRAAYVSGPAPTTHSCGACASARLRVMPFAAAGAPTPPAPEVGNARLPSDAGGTAPAQQVDPRRQASVFDLAVAAMEGHGLDAHRIWLPPLDASDTFDSLLPDLAVDAALGLVSSGWRRTGRLRFPLGTIDLPRQQRRDPLVVDLSGASGHLAVVGGPRSGKSTALRAVVTGLSLTHSPLEVQFYVLDLGGGTFTGLRPLPHVAGTASRSEPRVVSRVVAEVVGLTDAREDAFRAHGIDTIETYRDRRARGEVDDGWGDVFLVVDGWGALRVDFPDLESQLQVLAQRSLTFGVHLLTSSSRWMDYRSGLRDVLGTRIELRLGDPMDSEVDRRLAAAIPADRPGRALMPTRHHALTALPRIDGDPSPTTLGAGVADLVTRVAASWPGPPGPRLRLLPERVELEQVRAAAPPSSRLVLGLAERDLAPVGLDPGHEPHLLVLGDAGSGKSGLLRTYLQEVTRHHTPETAQIFLVDYRRAHLAEFDEAWVADYATSDESTRSLVGDLVPVLQARLPGPQVTPTELRARSWWGGKEAVVVVDDYELVATSQGNPLEALVPLLARAGDVGLHLVVARRCAGVGRLFDPLLTALRDLAQPGVLLSGDPAEGPLLHGARPTPAPPGRGRLLTRDGDETIQVAWSPSRHG